ncbi:YncE family protein [Humisphaera borealis]|uniref:Uncharacterized protein n=1 Tax=Humisphaera borealis TaxID=2807512 RepID=A0A7M2X4X8_9BACT|nr:hypothetical protein [Humisphaera borealis]QOV91840.1 hypothetical protein IPV69_10995 [Humisphaera borealis]
MYLSANELARRDQRGLQLQSLPLRVQWSLDDLRAADGHSLRCRYSCGVRAVDDPAEKQMLQEVLMGSRLNVTTDDVMRYMQATLREAAVATAKDKGVEAWLADDKELLATTLRRAGERAAFAAGIELIAPFQLDLESGSFEQKRLNDLQRTLAEQEAAGRVEHFNRAADLLKRFEEIRAKTPDLSPSAILGQLSPIDQGSTLQTLLLASAKQAGPQSLWAVSGEYLVKVDARAGGAATTELFPLPPTLGPLRSVQSTRIDGQRRLLVGARDGFFLFDPENPANPDVYSDGGVQSAMGFSRVLYHSHERGFAGCHGEAGLVRWSPGSTKPTSVIRPQRFGVPPPGASAVGGPPPLPNTSIAVPTRQAGPRNLEAIDDRRLLMSVGGRLWIVDGDEANEIASASSSEVVAIVPDGRTFHVVHEDGAIAAFDGPTRQIVGTRHRPMRVRAAGSLPWLGSRRLLLAGDEGAVQCIGGDDPLVTEYVSSHRALRSIAGSADLVAAVSSDRQRLIVWQTWEGRSPLAEIYITAKTKHRVADVDFG